MADQVPSNVFLVTGNDDAMIATEAAKIIRSVAGDSPDPFSLDVIREAEGTSAAETLNRLIRSILSPPFLGDRKTVWLQHFSRFDAEGTKSSKSAEATAFRELADHIGKGLPADIILVMDGPGADMRKALASACKDRGKLIVCKKPELRDANWESTMRELILSRAADKGVRLEEKACLYLIDILGTDTASIDSELEKLICYTGNTAEPIPLSAAEAVCSGQGEELSWALSNAIGERNLAEALRVVDVLSRQAKDPDKIARSLLMQSAGCIRQLLQARVLLSENRIRSAQGIRQLLDGMSADRKNALREEGIEIAGFHPYRASRLAEQSLRFSGPELIQALGILRDAYWRCVSSSASTRVLLEEAMVRIIGGPVAKR